MSAELLVQLRRLGTRQPKTRHDALLLLDDLATLRRGLVDAGDTVSRELARLRLNLDAARAYGCTKGRMQ